MTPINIGVSLKDDFFDDIESFLTEAANLDEVVSLFFIFFFSFLWI